MNKFLDKYVLFPKRFGFMPYFWVFSLFLMAGQILITQHPFNWFYLLLVLIFLKFYRDGYSINRWLWLDIGIQLLIAAYFTLKFPNGGGTFFIYTAWEIGSLPYKLRDFLRYLVLYLVISLSCVLTFILFTPTIKEYGPFGIIIALTFTIGSPIAARSLGNSYRRSYRTKQTNRRLETIIKQNERDRIAQDLHDSLGQSFSLITLKSELATKLIDKDPKKAQQQLKDIAQTSRDDLNLVRQIVADLNAQSIASAMVSEGKNLDLAQIQQISINEDVSNTWPKDIQHTLAAIIKETTTNVIRYSHANLMKFTFEEDASNYFLDIHDDGIGFKGATNHISYGLSGMTNRLKSINGTLKVTSDHGVYLQISIPKKD